MRRFYFKMLKNNTTNKEKSISALNKARRIVGKMIKMLEAGEPCQKIMSQNAKAVGLLRHAHKLIMEADLNNCLKAVLEN
jgi:DNA-binding FrmR family transcriptional regulator